MAVSQDELVESMYEIVRESMGKRNIKPNELVREALARYPAGACAKDDCKRALRELIDSGRCVYAYYGESCVTLPHKEGAAND